MSDKISDELLNMLADLLESARVYQLGEPDRDRLNIELYRRKTHKPTTEPGGLAWPEFAAKYGLHTSERRAAESTLTRRRYAHGIHYFADQEPTAEQRQYIADATTMSKRQACEYLNISPVKFDKLKKERGLEHVLWRTARERTGGVILAAFLYRKSDLDRLME